MKKWIRFFFLSFFSDKISKEGARRGYTNVLIGLVLAFALLWSGLVGADMLSFSAHYNNSPDFRETVRQVLANPDINKRVSIEAYDGRLKSKDQSSNSDGVLINTFENDSDRESYSVNGYNVIVDLRPADTLAAVEAYCISNDGKNTRISYEDYLSLSEVARLNFDFKLSYTGHALELSDSDIDGFREYVDGLSDENRAETERMENDLAEGKTTKSEYNRAIYELYFANYYPEITDYESTSLVPLLRNYYYHQYINGQECKYLFIFDDCFVASFETKSKTTVSFYGFYTDIENGDLIAFDSDQTKANEAADGFINKAFMAMAPISIYTYAMNVLSLIPFIALMPMVVSLLAYSILRLSGMEFISSLGATFKIVGSYVWFSAAISAVTTVIASFFIRSQALIALPLLVLFITLALRSVIFAINEAKSYTQQSEQQETVHTEA